MSWGGPTNILNLLPVEPNPAFARGDSGRQGSVLWSLTGPILGFRAGSEGVLHEELKFAWGSNTPGHVIALAGCEA